MRLADPFASRVRPALFGSLGAVAAAHPLAVAAGQEILTAGGGAVDAAIAAQAVLCVVAPDACGLGGDMFALVHEPNGSVVAVNGAGALPAASERTAASGACSITVPGLVDAWDQMSERWGRVPLAAALAPAGRLARRGVVASARLCQAVEEQRARLMEGGAGGWAVLAAEPGRRVVQNELASWLDRIGKDRASAFYAGDAAGAIEGAVRAQGGALRSDDLAGHRTVFLRPLSVRFRDATVHVQPPMAQGVLLALALEGLDGFDLSVATAESRDHLGVELTEAAFAHRDRAGDGEALLGTRLDVDPERAARRGGPRAYLHTAGVACSDRFGAAVSSLVSVFDDFGSGVFVPEGGFVLNNRAGGFTRTPNDPAPGKRPVHTLAPALAVTEHGPLALATPGADGQVQTLLQVLTSLLVEGADLAASIDRPRWRSEAGALLIGENHPQLRALEARGHAVRPLPDGDMRFGAVVAAGTTAAGPFAAADWRRDTWCGVA